MITLHQRLVFFDPSFTIAATGRIDMPYELVKDESRANVVIAALILCTLFSTLSFLGRIWGRTLSAVRLGWDDLLMTAALVSIPVHLTSSVTWHVVAPH